MIFTIYPYYENEPFPGTYTSFHEVYFSAKELCDKDQRADAHGYVIFAQQDEQSPKYVIHTRHRKTWERSGYLADDLPQCRNCGLGYHEGHVVLTGKCALAPTFWRHKTFEAWSKLNDERQAGRDPETLPGVASRLGPDDPEHSAP
jgi:hypothetical protein